MFTVEHEYDATVVVSLDETDQYQDVELIIGDTGGVYIRQYDEDMGQHEMIYCSFQQLLDILAALNATEGLHFVQPRKRKKINDRSSE